MNKGAKRTLGPNTTKCLRTGGDKGEKGKHRGHLDVWNDLFKMDRGNGAPWWPRISGRMQMELKLISVNQTPFFNG